MGIKNVSECASYRCLLHICHHPTGRIGHPFVQYYEGTIVLSHLTLIRERWSDVLILLGVQFRVMFRFEPGDHK